MKLPALVRVVHYYCSMACVFLIAFYALSGFIATHVDDLAGERRGEWTEATLALPSAAGDEELVGLITATHGGRPGAVDSDEDYGTLAFDLESVWFDATVEVDKEAGSYHIRKRPAPMLRSIVDLHRGKQASTLQVIMADATAILLLLCVITGAIIGIQHRKRRVWGYAGLATSLLLTVLLCLWR